VDLAGKVGRPNINVLTTEPRRQRGAFFTSEKAADRYSAFRATRAIRTRIYAQILEPSRQRARLQTADSSFFFRDPPPLPPSPAVPPIFIAAAGAALPDFVHVQPPTVRRK